MTKALIDELKILIEQGLEDVPFPYVKGNSVRIGNMIVRSSKNGNFVFDMKYKREVAHTFSKTAAVAIAKKRVEGHDVIKEVMLIDYNIEKNYNDAMHYDHSRKQTTDEMRKEVLECRLDIARSKIDHGRSQLEDYIYN
jgi:hypothetical protein